ncbi:Protein IQ-DOMAIN 29 [Linum grandiflorum]
MGTSPGKWLKSLIRGKKSSRSSLSKEKDSLKLSNGEALVSSKVPAFNSMASPQTLNISHPIPVIGTRSVVNSAHAESAESRNEKATALCGKEESGSPETSLDQVSEIVRVDDAATKAQEDVTDCLAPDEVDKDRHIVRLQAAIRGHLVRRQAVATLNCAWGIVKFQAVVRGQKVRRSSLPIESQDTINRAKLLALSAASGNPRSTLRDQNFENSFVRKLLTSTASAMPLALQYGPGEPNSAMEWLNRWTRSCFWEHVSQLKMDQPESESLIKQEGLEKVESQQGKQKQPVRKSSSANVANGIHGKTSESSKPKRNPRKPAKLPVDMGNKHPEAAPIKTKQASKKVSGSAEKVEADGVRPKRNVKKVSATSAEGVLEQDSQIAADVAKNVVPVEVSGQAEEVNGVLTNVQENNNILQLGPNDAIVENPKTSQRRASLPANVDQQENGVLGTPKLPSYMTPTQSAKAKLRGTGSATIIPQEGIEKTGSATTRRHSLPSSINEKCVSMSPRAYRQVHSGSKGFIRSDRSLTSSRDGSVSDRMIRPEWRR